MPNDVISKIQLPNGNTYDLRDNNAIKENLSYSTATYPYTGQELLFLRNPVTNTNSVTDLTTLLSFFTNSGDTDQSALVHYVKTVSLIASTEAQTFEDEKISSSMVVIEYTFSNPLAQYTDLNITTTDGSVTITGTITEATNLTLYFGVAVSVPPTIQVNLGSTTADSILKINSTPGVFGVLPVNNGGTGLSAAPSLLVRLSSTTAANIFEQNPRPGVIGTLAIENGGTNANNAADARTNLDITPANIGALALTGGTLTGALTATAFNGPLTGNVTGHASSDLALSGGTLTGDLFFSNSGTTTRQIRGIAGDNDYWRIAGGATASNAGWMEIATADDGNEPIYVRQYTGAYTTVKRTLTLLDGSGNTSIPGQLQFPGRGANYLSIGPNDAANGVGGALNNLVFSSWYGVSFTTSCTGTTYTGTNAVSINCRTGNVYAAKFNGPLAGNVTGNVTGNCSGSSGSCTGNAATATRASSASGLWTRTSLIKGTNPSSTQWTGPAIFTYQTGSGTAVTDRIAGGLESSIDANGLSTLHLCAYRFASGQSASNAFEIKCAKDGTASYSVTDQYAFRNAIGASSGTWPISMGGTGGASVAAATNNLGLTYAANNTDSYQSWGASGVLMNSSKTVRVHFYTSKSMANISTVTVTKLDVVIRGVKGALNSSTSYTNYVGASGYTITATKRNNYLIQLELVKSSAFSNVLDNSPVCMVGTIDLKFT